MLFGQKRGRDMHIGGQKRKQIIQRIIVAHSITHSPTNRD